MADVQSKNVFDLLGEGDDEVEQEQEAPKAAAAKKDGVKAQATRGRGGSQAARGGHRAPKHEHERKSATGRSNEPTKKGGAGKYSWGKEEESAAVVEETPAAAAPADAAEPAAAGVAAEPEEPTVGLDDYFKTLEAKRPTDDLKIAPRAAVVDEKTFKGKVYTKTEEESLFADLVKPQKERVAKEAKKKNVVSLDEWNAKIPQPAREQREFQPREPREFQPREPREFQPREQREPREPREPRQDGECRGRGGFRGGRGRGGDAFDEARGRGRGRGRGGRGRGGERGAERGGDRPAGRGRGGPRGGNRGTGPRETVNLNDDAAFPSLGK